MNQRSPAACFSFGKILIRFYFTASFIRSGFFIAVLISNFIFVSLLNSVFLDFVSPFLSIFGLYILLNSPRQIWLHTGFFIGILWFYWISFSLIYYDFAWLIPFEIFGIAVVYGLIFLVCGWIKHPIWRIALLCLSVYVHPFGFNWFVLPLILMPGIFEPNIRGLLFVLLAATFFVSSRRKFNPFFPKLNSKISNIIAVIFLICALQFKAYEPNFLPFKTHLVNTQIPQSLKWEDSMHERFIKEALQNIQNAINSGFDYVVLPENALVAYLNVQPVLIEILKEYSYQIDITIGALADVNNYSYNSAYYFSKGEMQRFDKSYLVPFGEEIPLPNFAKNWINKVFFDGANDFASSKHISQYEIHGVKVRSAICYEATRSELYKDDPKFIIAITNNGWFVPSTQPILQHLLIKYFASSHHTTVYHSVNGSPSEIIAPKQLWIDEFLAVF